MSNRQRARTLGSKYTRSGLFVANGAERAGQTHGFGADWAHLPWPRTSRHERARQDDRAKRRIARPLASTSLPYRKSVASNFTGSITFITDESSAQSAKPRTPRMSHCTPDIRAASAITCALPTSTGLHARCSKPVAHALRHHLRPDAARVADHDAYRRLVLFLFLIDSIADNPVRAIRCRSRGLHESCRWQSPFSLT